MRASQLAGRVRRLLPPRLVATRLPPGEPPPRWTPIAEGLGADEAPQSGPTPAPHTIGAFYANGVVRPVDAPDFWADSSDGLLFLFHLHGFTRLAEYAAGPRSPEGDAFWVRLTEDWLERHSRPRMPA